MFIRVKAIKGKNYYYLVENTRNGEKVKQKVIKYLGTTKPNAAIVIDSLKCSA